MKKENKAIYSVIDAAWAMVGQFFTAPEYLFIILTGFALFAGILPTYNVYALGAYLLYGLAVGFFTIFRTIWAKNKVFESLGFDFGKGFGRARWLVSGVEPLAQSVLRINSGGYPVKDFEARRDEIAMRLRQPIKEIRQPVPTVPVIEIELLKSKIPTSIGLLDLPFDTLQSGEFFIGMGDGGVKKMTLTQMIHMLFAGQTGMGKTSFLKQFLTTVLARTRDSHVILVDMKGGIDFQAFEDLPNLELVTSVHGADAALDKLKALFNMRGSYLLKKKKERWIDLNPKDLREEAAFSDLPIGPVVFIVDELAELMRGSEEGVSKAVITGKIEQLAQLARFTGIHLVLGTQRPEKSVISMQIKDNMGTRVCFSVPSVHASTLVINDMSASTLGGIPGRAVCVAGGSSVVQCPAVSNDTVKMLLEQSPYLRETRNKPPRLLLSTPVKNTAVPRPKIRGLHAPA